MKRLLYFGLSASLFLSALTGCGSTASTAAAGTSEVSASAAEETEDLDDTAVEEETLTADSGETPDAPPSGGPGEPPTDGTPGEPPTGGAPGEPPSGGMPGGAPGSSSSSDIDYTGAVEISSADSRSDQEYVSSTSDESALLISTSDEVTISDPTVTKTGDSDGGDNCNFYGLNAAVLVKDGATVTISGGTVTSDASGANGVFCYGGNGGQNGADGDGTTLNIYDTVITTTGDGSGGIMTTGGGITNAYNLTVETSGQSSAAIRTDRGGGTVVVDGGSYTSNGLGSPAIYSTADITVANAQLTSNLSEGVCIEGLNSITLNNCNLTASNTKCNGNARSISPCPATRPAARAASP